MLQSSQSKPSATVKSPPAATTPKPDAPASKKRPGRPKSLKSPPLDMKTPVMTSPTGPKQTQPGTFKTPSGSATGEQRSPVLSGTPKDKTDAKQDLQMKIRAKMKVMEADKTVKRCCIIS